jgi:predicted kinase
MPIVHLLHGFIGSGKTSFARQLEQDKSAFRFSPDEWMVALYGDNPEEGRFEEYYQRIDQWIWVQIERALALGVDVIFDSGLWKRADRDRMIDRVKSLGADPILYALQCPFEVSRERVLKRTAEMPEGQLKIDDNAIHLFWSKFEQLQDDEEAIIIDTSAA